MHRSTVARLKIETDLHRALKNQELELYYQPIVNTFTCEISGFEALLRWHHPERGFISPTQFIPIAEESSLMLDIGWWVLGQACGQARLWQQTFDHCQSLVMNVNLSSKQLFQVDYLAQIETILANTAFNPNGLALEITESTFIKAFESTDEKLQHLRKLGIALSIDDFGTGYSSLSYLSRFPFNTLKIDRSFIQSLGNNADQSAIVEAIILLGHKLGLEIVAEGVETLAQYHWLQQQGCDKIQGYLFLPAMNAKTITTLLQTGRQLPLTNDIFGHFA
ncbi:MAG: EAL domain-containing protein [Cyanobacteria bacterium]|nr:EAL domain-containing protein [Cyanobacteriota bacterium]